MSSQWLFILSCVVWFVDECWILLREGLSAEVSKDRLSRLLIVSLVVVGIVLGMRLGKSGTFPLPLNAQVAFVFGSILIFTGVAFRNWSVRTLGAFFRTTVMVQKGHRVIKHGPYKFLRHPSYTGGLISCLGVGIAQGSWASIAIILLFALSSLLYRMNIEEAALEKSLGAEYRDYKKHTKRLIPFIY